MMFGECLTFRRKYDLHPQGWRVNPPKNQQKQNLSLSPNSAGFFLPCPLVSKVIFRNVRLSPNCMALKPETILLKLKQYLCLYIMQYLHCWIQYTAMQAVFLLLNGSVNSLFRCTIIAYHDQWQIQNLEECTHQNRGLIKCFKSC